jgi:ribose 5-phosphate isomerase A
VTPKEILGLALANELQQLLIHPTVIGVGTGSTVDAALKALKELYGSLKGVTAVTTSKESARACHELGIRLIPLELIREEISFTFDGADFVDKNLRLIKGRGGALFQEKILTKLSKRIVILVEESKIQETFDERCIVPLEVSPVALPLVEYSLRKFSPISITLREAGNGKYGAAITEQGNYILDVTFSNISDTLESDLKSITGVIESGLFTNFDKEVWTVGKEEKIRKITI